jgi:hypothetical protein
MTRRDRYALALALECLRTPPKVTRVPMYALHALPEEIREAWEIARYEVGVPHRLLRARLALLLRVMLRVDAGDVRRWRCPQHGRSVAWDWHDEHGEEWWCSACRRWRISRIDPPTCRIRPLWEIAAREAGR